MHKTYCEDLPKWGDDRSNPALLAAEKAGRFVKRRYDEFDRRPYYATEELIAWLDDQASQHQQQAENYRGFARALRVKIST